jgi:hypothetical protein
MSRTDAQNGLDFHFNLLIVTKYQAQVQIQMESYKLLSLTYSDISLSQEAIENRFSIRIELEGRRRRLIKQTTRKENNTNDDAHWEDYK